MISWIFEDGIFGLSCISLDEDDYITQLKTKASRIYLSGGLPWQIPPKSFLVSLFFSLTGLEFMQSTVFSGAKTYSFQLCVSCDFFCTCLNYHI